MPGTITIKTTGGDIHITPDPRDTTQDHASKILDHLEDSDDDWMNFHVDHGQATIRARSIVAVIARNKP